MAEYTENYNFKKPLQEEFYNVEDFNGNADIADAALRELSERIGSLDELETDDFRSVVKAVNSVYETVDGILNSITYGEKGCVKFGKLVLQWGKISVERPQSTTAFTAAFPKVMSDVYNLQLTLIADGEKIAAGDVGINVPASGLNGRYLTLDATDFLNNGALGTKVDVYWLIIGRVS